MTARPRRRKVDWAREVADLLQGLYAKAEKVILVCDNLNKDTPGVLRSLRCGHGPIAGTPPGVPPHAEAWQLAERGRERVEFVDAAVCERLTLRHAGRIASRDHRVADGREPPLTGS